MELPINGFAQNISGNGLHADELRKLILKLRWIGMGEEAERLRMQYRRELSDECVFLASPDTD
jgi:hypothetical protein